jgi:hypothetical protein
MAALAANTPLLGGSEFGVRLFIDLVAITLLAQFLYLRRHGRRDLFMVFVAFNIGLFAVLSVISSRHINVGLGFGLFAVLSIIRLRSSPFSNLELGYFFSTLVLGLVNGLAQTPLALTISLNLLVLGTVWVIDHPSLHTNLGRREVTLDSIELDPLAIRARLADAFGLQITEVSINAVDYVREVTRVTIRFVDEGPLPTAPELRDWRDDDDDD